MVLAYFMVFITGFLVKLTDKTQNPLFGLLYGSLVGLLSFFNPLVAAVFVPTVFANWIAGKIDSLAHYAALLPFFVFLIFFPPTLSPLALLFFSAAYFDEILRIKWLYPRPILPLSALAIGLGTFQFAYLAVALLFDTGYLTASHERGAEEASKPNQRRKATSKSRSR